MALRKTASLFVFIAMCGLPPAAAAQMNYSMYTDMWGSADAFAIWGYSELIDYSGCASGGWLTGTELFSPSRWTGSSGAFVNMSWEEEEGTWTVVGRFTIECSCASPWGGTHTFSPAASHQRRTEKFAARFQKVGAHGAGKTRYIQYQCEHKCQTNDICPAWDPAESPQYAVARGMYIDPPGGCTGTLHGTNIDPTGSCYGPAGEIAPNQYGPSCG